ncbi:Sarcolemmal membrane-associated protein [Apostichopus japonicus]|uniref:Sarcolemmal membrane-associated protein n=1 Tax=Stichopus japonicus TaxID=307972 RepID=A0A2G8LEY1_STIJA|nr:Sarcolemmal membrane-associated protein [Apostichopus japonicus]
MLIMSAVAVLTCHPSSHPFQTRRIDLNEPVKIGRSVAKARPAPENAIFDCKVLSRNHALLLFDKEKGMFCLQDTKSSNGTFVNNQRLTRGTGENPETEVRSGDIVQFGVDVVDTSKRVVGECFTHGRIVAQLTLYNPDGSEAVRSTPIPSVPNTNDSPPGAVTNNNMVSQQLFQLSCWLKANSEESIRVELAQLQEDKHMYETTAKESLKKALEEKLEASQNYADMEQKLTNSKEEGTHLTQQLDNLNNEQKTLLEKYSNSVEEVQQLTETLADLEKKHLEEMELMREDKNKLEDRINKMEAKEGEFAERLQKLQSENYISIGRHGADSVGTIKPSSTFNGDLNLQAERRDEGDGAEITPLKPPVNGDEVGLQVSGITERDATLALDDTTEEKSTDSDASTPESEVPLSTETSETLERLKAQVEEITERLKPARSVRTMPSWKLSNAQMETIHQTYQYLATSSIQIYFSILKPSDELSDLREKKKRDEPSKGKDKDITTENGLGTEVDPPKISIPEELTVIQNHVDKEYIARLEQKHCEQLEHEYKEIESLKKEISKLQEIQQRLKDEKAIIEKNLENSQAENHLLQTETKQYKEQITKSIVSAKEAKKEIMELRDQLKLEKQSSKTKDTTVQHAEELLAREKRISLERKKKLEDLEKTQTKCQKTAKSNERELEKLKELNLKLQKDLEREKFLRNEAEKKVKRQSVFRKDSDLRKGQKKENESDKMTKRIAEIEPVIAVKEEQTLQQKDQFENKTSNRNYFMATSEPFYFKANVKMCLFLFLVDLSDLQKDADQDGSREPEDRLSEDLAKLRDRLRDVGVKASPEGKQGARLKSELSKSHEEVERLISTSREQEAEKDRLQRELKRLREVDGTETIAGIPVSQLPIVVIIIAITAALLQNLLAL